jgi:hypothetical protein
MKEFYKELEEWFYPIEPFGILVFVIITIISLIIYLVV